MTFPFSFGRASHFSIAIERSDAGTGLATKWEIIVLAKKRDPLFSQQGRFQLDFYHQVY